LKRAVESCGGLEAVAAALQESPRQIQEWLDGGGFISNDVFLRIVDVLLERDPAYHIGASANQEATAPQGRR
jgi:hypothetical protein